MNKLDKCMVVYAYILILHNKEPNDYMHLCSSSTY